MRFLFSSSNCYSRRSSVNTVASTTTMTTSSRRPVAVNTGNSKESRPNGVGGRFGF